jgi:hypothetical protein
VILVLAAADILEFFEEGEVVEVQDEVAGYVGLESHEDSGELIAVLLLQLLGND